MRMKMKRQLALAKNGDEDGDGADVAALIPGIPDDLALLCLARLPSRSQAKHRCVSLLWKQALESQTLFRLRLHLHLLETHLLLCFTGPSSSSQRSLSWWVIDPVCVRYYPIAHPSLPLGFPFRSISTTAPGQVLFLEGKDVSRFDLFRRRCLRPSAPPLLTNRDGFASAALDGHVYVAGGYMYRDIGGERYNNRGPLKSVERLDCTHMSTWERMPDMHYGRAAAAAVVVDGKLYVIGGGHDEESECSGEIWDPKQKEWLLVPQLWPFRVFGHSPVKVTAVMGRLLAIKEPANEIMLYEDDTRLWTSLGSIPFRTFCTTNAVSISFYCKLFGVGSELWVLVQSEVLDDLLFEDLLDDDGFCIAHPDLPEVTAVDVFFLACLPLSGGPLAWRRLPYCFDGSFQLLTSARITI